MSTENVEKILRSDTLTTTEKSQLEHIAETLPRVDIDYLMDSLRPSEAALLFRALPPHKAQTIFAGLQDAQQADLVEELGVHEAAPLISALNPDDRAGLFDELPPQSVDHFMRGLDATERTFTSSILEYDRNQIGRYMSPKTIGLLEDLTAGEALRYLQSRIDEPETIYVLPVVNSSGQVRGVVELRALLSATEQSPLSALMEIPYLAEATESREPVARLFLEENLLAMPIVDSEKNLLGILTIDDALEIVREEDDEDAARGGGRENLRRSYLSTPIFSLVKSRIVWLFVLAISAILTVQVLELFEDKLNEVVVLALFIPLLTGTGGNTGNQAATTVTRALALGEVRVRDLLRVMWRELRVGIFLGASLGALGFVVATWVYGLEIGTVIGLTLLSICAMAACVGGLMPIVAKKVGADPAVFSNPFISTFCDATGLIIYFTIASVVLGI